MAGRVQVKQFVTYSVDYEQSLLSSSVEQNARDAQMIASPGFTARRSLACALPSLNLKKRRDYSQSAYSVCIFYFLFSRMGSALLSRFDLVSLKHQDYILSFVRSWAVPSCSALNTTVCCASAFLLLNLWTKSLSVITYKNCEMLLSAAFYYAAQSRNDTFIYNQLFVLRTWPHWYQ